MSNLNPPSITVRSHRKATPQEPAAVEIEFTGDGPATFNFQSLNQALSHAASASPDSEVSTVLRALGGAAQAAGV